MRAGMFDTQAIRQRWESVGSKLDERGRRVFAAGEVRAAGWGGASRRPPRWRSPLDAGGSNGTRVRLWKVELQKLADRTGLVLHVHHYPPGTSKWNKIEHRMFCHITQTWRGRPLVDRMAVAELIATTTKAGLPESRERARNRDLRKGHQSQQC